LSERIHRARMPRMPQSPCPGGALRRQLRATLGEGPALTGLGAEIILGKTILT